MQTNQQPQYHIGDKVFYGLRIYTILSVKHGDIAGPHYRLGACGDYPGENLTSWQLLRPATAEAK